MTLCRWFHIPTRRELYKRLTKEDYDEWADYFARNACHPLAVPMSIGINSLVQASAWGGNKGQRKKPEDFVAYLPKKKIDFADTEALQTFFMR